MTSWRWHFTSGMLFVLLLGSCGDPGADADPPRGEAVGGAITVGTHPVLTIGREGDARYEFTEIVGVGRLSSGEWVVFDRGSRQLRIYRSNGEHIRTVGRAGEGPGEFRDVLRVSTGADDRTYIYDQMLRRVTVMDSRGEVSGTYPIPPFGEGTVPAAVGFSGDGSIVLQSHLISACRPAAVSEDTTVFHRVSFQGRKPPEVLARATGIQRWGSTLNVLGTCMWQVVPYAPGPIAAAGDSVLVVAVRGEPGIRRYRLSSGEAQLLPIAAGRRAVTREAVDQYIQGQVAAAPRDELGRELPRDHGMQLYERRLRELPYPDSLPHFDRVIIDRAGLVWVRQYALGSDSSSTWLVLRQNGEVVDTVSLPTGFSVLDIGEDYIAGHQRDGLDVQRVVAYHVSR